MKYLFTLALSCITFTASFSQVVINNNGSLKIFVAICYLDKSTGWTSKGWFPIEAGQKSILYNYSSLSEPDFYYCAHIAGYDDGWYGNTPVYVNTKDAFTLPNVNNKTASINPLIRRRDFIKVELKGKKNYTINLTPQSVNLTSNKLKQGKWIFGLDKEGDYAEKKEDFVYTREVTFDAGRPIGWCRDYYQDGKIKSEFKLSSFNPVVYEGKCTWYKQDGSLEKEIAYKNGVEISKTIKDSTGTFVTKSSMYKVKRLPLQNFYVRGQQQSGRSQTAFYVQLPPNTVAWYYEFAATKDQEDVASIQNKFTATAQIAKAIDITGITSGIINLLTPPPGAEICNIFVLDGSYYNLFLENGDYRYYAPISRINSRSGVIEVNNLTIPQPIIGIQAVNNWSSVYVSVQVTAIVRQL